MKRKLLVLLLALLPFASMAQRPVEPIRLKVSGPADPAEHDRELSAELRRHFGKLRDVAFVEQRPDFTIHYTATALDTDRRCSGVGAAIVVVRGKNHRLDLFTAATMGELAAFIAETINKEDFESIRAGAGR
jgi:hypothetical protein